MRSKAHTTFLEVDVSRTEFFGISAVLLLCIALVFGQTIGADFVNYDDDTYVYANPHVASGLTLGNLKWLLGHGHSDNWHPLTSVSHMLDATLYGLNPAGHHLTNVVFHA